MKSPNSPRLVKRLLAVLLSACMVLGLAACGSGGGEAQEEYTIPEVSAELVYDHSMELETATEFQVHYYADGYKLIDVEEGTEMYLIVPEGKEAPADLQEGVTVIQQPLENIYLVATAAMDMFRALDAMDTIRLSGLNQQGWYIQEAIDAMAAGDILYAGKYNLPDYETILAENCDLALESTMIYHNPEVLDIIEGYGIPVFVDKASYESEPLGRVEWIKVYGAMLNEEEAAEAAYRQQAEIFEEVLADTEGADTGKTVSYFYVTNNGQVSTRKSFDYIPTMIAYAGGVYIPDDLEGDPESHTGTIALQMEEYYASCKDADILIYNSSIDAELQSIDDLITKSPFLADFKAVQEGNVWCTGKGMYQESMEMGYFLSDMHKILLDPTTPDEELEYLYRLQA